MFAEDTPDIRRLESMKGVGGSINGWDWFMMTRDVNKAISLEDKAKAYNATKYSHKTK